MAIHFAGYHIDITIWQRRPTNQASSCYKNCNCLPNQPQLSDNTWIYPLELYKKRFQFADKSMTWKNVFPQFWQAPLRGQQLPRVAATFRPGREQSFRQLPKLVGQKKEVQQQRLLVRKKASSRRPGEESSPN
jgi:hypothetical protein